MNIKVKIAKQLKEDIVSSIYSIRTFDSKFVDELKKYTCPMRLLVFLDKEKTSYQDLDEQLKDKDCQLIIDLSDKFEEIVSNGTSIGDYINIYSKNYIDITPDLDKYGN